MYVLVLSKDISSQNKKNLKKLVLLFSNVNTLKVNEIRWNDIKYNRHNSNYSGIINIC